MWGSIACVYVADVVEVDNVCLGLRVFTLQVRANFKSGSVSTSVRVRMPGPVLASLLCWHAGQHGPGHNDANSGTMMPTRARARVLPAPAMMP